MFSLVQSAMHFVFFHTLMLTLSGKETIFKIAVQGQLHGVSREEKVSVLGALA